MKWKHAKVLNKIARESLAWIDNTHPAFTYGTLLKRCGKNTSTTRRAPTDGTRHCMLSICEVMFF